MPASERCTHKIIRRIPDGLQADVRAAVLGPLRQPATEKQVHDSALRVLNESLLPAMKTVGDRFGAGELILPYVLRSAECMKMAVSEIEKYLISDEGASKGTIVLGTVYGDVHDIGKNLVKTIFQNNGYAVHDLGKQVPIKAFVDKIRETNADAVGLSALLVSTSKQMHVFVEYARANGLDIPILCGGAAINSAYVNRMATTVNGDAAEPYSSGMFYCKDMFDGLRVVDGLLADRAGLLARYDSAVRRWQARDAKYRAAAAGNAPKKAARSAVRPLADVRMPRGRRLGEVRHMRNIPFREHNIWDMIDKKSLFTLSWGVRGRAATAERVAEYERLFTDLQETIADREWFEPYVAYGFFGCRSSGDALRVYGADGNEEFAFPRSGRKSGLCIADYFNSYRDDVVALQVVTVGSNVADVIEEYNKAGRHVDAYHLHGMAVAAAEGLAEYCNRQVCLDLGLQKALRYSWGYASCPDITQHNQVWRLLKPDDCLRLTDAGQIIPEFSTAAIVVPHPDAKYFEL